MIKGGRTPFFFSGQQLSPPFLISLPLLASHRASKASLPIGYSHLQPLDTSGRASARGKAADAGHLCALERLAEHPTIDAALPPPRASPSRQSRCLDVRNTPPCRPPRLSLSLTSCSACPEPPGSANARAAPVAACSSPRSSSLFLVPHSTPTDAVDSPSPSLLASRSVAAATRASRPR